MQHAGHGAGVRAQRQRLGVLLSAEHCVAPFGDGEVEGGGAHFGEAEGSDGAGCGEGDGVGGEAVVDVV